MQDIFDKQCTTSFVIVGWKNSLRQGTFVFLLAYHFICCCWYFVQRKSFPRFSGCPKRKNLIKHPKISKIKIFPSDDYRKFQILLSKFYIKGAKTKLRCELKVRKVQKIHFKYETNILYRFAMETSSYLNGSDFTRKLLLSLKPKGFVFRPKPHHKIINCRTYVIQIKKK